MRIGSVLLFIWLIIGGFAAGQRGDYHGRIGNCSQAGTIAVTGVPSKSGTPRAPKISTSAWCHRTSESIKRPSMSNSVAPILIRQLWHTP